MPPSELWPLLPLAIWGARSGLLFGAQKLAARDHLSLATLSTALALFCWPFSAAVWTRLGNVLGDLKAWPWASHCFALALKLRPQYIEAQLGAGTAALINPHTTATERWQKADWHLLQAYFLRRGRPCNLPSVETAPGIPLAENEPSSPELADAFKMKLNWLQEQNLLPPECLKTEHSNTPEAQTALYLERPSWPHSPLQNCPTTDVYRAYRESPGLAWYDGLLEPEALQTLLQFCQRSTFWHHRYQNGYLGAYLDDGFTCPLLYQIATALQESLPELLGELQLVYMWSFKCHHRGTGVALHHDSATVNVNFWLTPDSANRNNKSGGLCVYTTEPPDNWDLERYAVSPQQIRTFLEARTAEPQFIPYRQNRVVIFNSRLFHATQDFDFEPGYAQQRINVTLLFGRQPLRYHPKQPLPEQLWQEGLKTN